MNMAYFVIMRKVDIFVVYLVIDASYGKMDAKFVIPDPENLQRRIFFENQKFLKKKADTYG